MKEVNLDVIKMQGSYRVLAKCGTDCNIFFETRSEDTAYDVYHLAEEITAMIKMGSGVEISEGISQNGDDCVIMVEFDDGKLRTIRVDKNDGDAEDFLSTIADWTQDEDE